MVENNILSQYLKSPNNIFALLAKYRVLVPGIQRHYVQGSDTPKAKDVRDSFLKSIFKAAKNNNELDLHFIYGPIKIEGEDAFTPVDGQQRLTTLWLLAIYATEELEDKNKRNYLRNLLSRFSYSERIHATRFCKELTSCKSDRSWDIGKDPKESIPRQDWFWDYWKEDETVSSMIEMLSTIYRIWDKGLSGEAMLNFIASKATFELKTDAFGDDIYMKMNARGLQLTQWENFKGRFADLLSTGNGENDSDYINKYREVNNFEGKTVKDIWDVKIEELSNKFYDASYDEKLGTQELPDNAFFALIARLSVYISGSENECGEQIKSLSEFTDSDWININLSYVPFDDFKNIFFKSDKLENKDIPSLTYLKEFAIKTLTVLDNVLSSDNYKKSTPYWSEKRLFDAFFHPRNVNDCDFSLSCFEYFSEYQKPSTEDFETAQRFMWNILENVSRNDSSSPDKKSNEWNRVSIIRDCALLKNPTLYPQDARLLLNNYSAAQVKEEVEKALQLNNENQQIPSKWEESELGTWEGWSQAIRKAESYAFFHGTIRFLYSTNEKGNVIWDDFGIKFQNCKKIFNDEGLKVESWPEANKILLSYCNDWENQLRLKNLFGQSSSNWLLILKNNQYKEPVHYLLKYYKVNSNTSGDYQDVINTLIEDDSIWQMLIKSNAKDNYILEWRAGSPSLWLKYNPLWTIKLRQTERDKILDALLRKDENFLDNSCYLKGNETRYYICSSIRIKYKGYSFIWQDWDWVDMIDIYDEITCWDKGPMRKSPWMSQAYA